jgi:hypothetical protein
MRITAVFTLAVTLMAPAAFGESPRTYVGVITDTMCNTDHKPMNVSPESKCVRDCVGDAKTYKYALADGNRLYLLSDQQTPGELASQKVRVTGVLYPKTNILKVERIERVH